MKNPAALALASSLILISSTASATCCSKTFSNQYWKHTSSRPNKYTQPNPNPQPVNRGLISDHKIVNVITSPQLGLAPAYDASNVLEQQPSINEDLVLLQQKSSYLNTAHSNLRSPLLEISGGTEGQFHYNTDSRSTDPSEGLNLSTAELDSQFIASNWANAYFSFAYSGGSSETGGPGPKEELFLKRGFLTIGDLNKSSFYLSMGKMYVPFGTYSSAMISSPITTSVGRILSPTMVVGFFYKGINVVAFAYNGSQTKNNNHLIKQGGGRIGFTTGGKTSNFAITAGYVTNIADAQGMQDNGNIDTSKFSGFTKSGQPSTNIPGADISLQSTFDMFTFKGEFVTALSSFDKSDLEVSTGSSSGKGATPRAMHAEVDISTQLFNKPYTFGIFYGHTWDGLAMNLSQNTFGAVISTSLIRDTIESIQYQRFQDYPSSDWMQGKGSAKQTGSGASHAVILAQIGVYF